MQVNIETTITFNRPERAVIEEAVIPIRIVYPDYGERDKRSAVERAVKQVRQAGQPLTRNILAGAREALNNLLAECKEESEREFWEDRESDGGKSIEKLIDVLVETRAYQARACEEALAVLDAAVSHCIDHGPPQEIDALAVLR